MAVRIKNFIVQLFYLPVSLIINFFAISPILYFVLDMSKEENGLFILLMMIAFCLAGFGLNRLFFRLKGRKTDKTFLALVKHDVLTDVDFKYDKYTKTITQTNYYTPITCEEYVTKRTQWGWIATFLSFVAFPMRLLSVLMAYAALMFPRIFVTAKKLSDNMPKNNVAVITHTLFDFVILPKKKNEDRKASALGLIYILVYIVAVVALHIVFLSYLVSILNKLPYAVEIPYALFAVFCILTDVILLIKYSIVICYDFSNIKAIVNLIKLIAFPIVLLLVSFALSYLPYADWGFQS